MSKSTHSLRKNQILKLHIESMSANGQGVAKHDGIAVFVDQGVTGDVVEAELYDVRKDFALAKILRIKHESVMRREPPCKLARVCGGCQWQHLSYEAQLESKTDIMRQAIKRIAGLSPDMVLPTIAAPDELFYRNKVQFPVASPHKSDRILAGYYKQGSHELVNIKHCPVQPELLDEVLEEAKFAAEEAGYSAYKEETHSGLIRHMIARHSYSENEVLFTVVLNMTPDVFANFRESMQKFASILMKRIPEVKGFCVNFNPSKGNRIMGNTTQLINGRDYIIEKLSSQHAKASTKLRGGLKFQLSPASFFQVNSMQAVQLMDLVLEAVIEYTEKTGVEKLPLIIDAFAGVGSIALWVSDFADKVIAVEEVADAIKDAEKIKLLNGVENLEPILGRVEDVFPRLVEEKVQAPILILDPPRKGVDASALEAVSKLNPQRVIYVSCNPATLARDLKILESFGYKTKSVQPLDLFPQTFHVESVSILDRD